MQTIYIWQRINFQNKHPQRFGGIELMSQRVGHFIDFLGDARGGAETTVEGLCRHLPAMNVESEIVASRDLFRRSDFSSVTVPIHTGLGAYSIRESSFKFRGTLSDVLYRVHGWVYPPQIIRYLLSFDLCHLHSFDVLAWASALQRWLPPFMITVYNPVARRHLGALERAVRIIVQSREVQTRLLADAPQLETRTVYIPPGCETKFYRCQDKYGARRQHSIRGTRILFVGRLRPFKNLPLLIRALPELVRQLGPGTRLTVVGAGPEMTTCRILCAQIGVSWAVDFVGTRCSEFMGELYQGHDVVVVPSFYESFSLVSLEAMVAGRRLVVSTGLTELLSMFPHLSKFSPHSEEELVHAVVETINSAQLDVPLDRLVEFEWLNVARRHADVYADVLRGGVNVP